MHRVDPTEPRAAELHRRVAARLRAEPGAVALARARLERAIAREGEPLDPALGERRDALRMLDALELAEFLESDTPRARRMRTSSPLRWLAR